jgi:hypothetical protein
MKRCKRFVSEPASKASPIKKRKSGEDAVSEADAFQLVRDQLSRMSRPDFLQLFAEAVRDQNAKTTKEIKNAQALQTCQKHLQETKDRLDFVRKTLEELNGELKRLEFKQQELQAECIVLKEKCECANAEEVQRLHIVAKAIGTTAACVCEDLDPSKIPDLFLLPCGHSMHRKCASQLEPISVPVGVSARLDFSALYPAFAPKFWDPSEHYVYRPCPYCRAPLDAPGFAASRTHSVFASTSSPHYSPPSPGTYDVVDLVQNDA